MGKHNFDALFCDSVTFHGRYGILNEDLTGSFLF